MNENDRKVIASGSSCLAGALLPFLTAALGMYLYVRPIHMPMLPASAYAGIKGGGNGGGTDNVQMVVGPGGGLGNVANFFNRGWPCKNCESI